MRVFDWGKKRRSFDSVALDPTGRTLAAGGNYQPTVVWDIVTGAERVWFDAVAYSVQFHPLDGRLFFSTKEGVQSYDPRSGAVAVAIADKQHNAAVLAFAPNEDWAVHLRRFNEWSSTLTATTRFGEPNQAPLWTVGFGASADESGGHAWSLACLPGGECFMSAERVFVSTPPHQHDRLAVRSRADGRLLHASPKQIFNSQIRVFGSPWNDAIVILDRARFQVYRSSDLAAPPHSVQNDKRRDFTGIAFHPSGRYLAATSNDETVKLYDTTTWEVARTFTWDIGKMRSIAFSPDGTLAAAGSDSGKVVVWDVDV